MITATTRFTQYAGLLGALLLLGACGREPTPAASDNPLLAWVPADSAYVMGNLQPVPANIVDAHLARLQPMLDSAQQQLDRVQADLEESSAQGENDADVAVMRAVLAEFDGKLNRAGLESMGLSLEAFHAAYAIGLFPALRVTLADASKFRAMVDRIEAAGADVPEFEHDGQAYWRVDETESGLSGYAAILDDHLVLAILPLAEEAQWLPMIVGDERPAESMADGGALAQLVADKDFEPYGAAYIDIGRVLEEAMTADRPLPRHLARMGAFDVSSLDPACQREARLIAGVVPRLVAGTTEVTANTVAMRYQAEVMPLVAGRMAELVSDVPPATAGPEHLASLSLSVDVGRMRRFLQDSAATLAAAPFQCPQLADLNEDIQQMKTMLDQPVPPFIGNLKGFRAVLDSVDVADPAPENVSGMLAVEMVSPQMVIGAASMMIPGFDELGIEPGGEPVQLPQDLVMVATPDFEMHAMMTSDAIGLAVGKGQSAGLQAFLEQRSASDGVFLSAEYDGGMLADLQEAQVERLREENPEAFDEAGMADIDPALLGRARFEMIFDDQGVTVNHRQSYP